MAYKQRKKHTKNTFHFLTTVWAHGTTLLINSPQKRTCKTTFWAPCLSGIPPPPSIQTTTVLVHGTTVSVNSPENIPGNLRSEPHVYQGFPPLPIHTKTTVWVHGTTVIFNLPQKPTGKQLSAPHGSQGTPPPPTPSQITTVLLLGTTKREGGPLKNVFLRAFLEVFR